MPKDVNGKTCICASHSAGECACGANWDSEELVELRREVKFLRAQNKELAAGRPIGPITGAMTILEQQEEIKRLERRNQELLDMYVPSTRETELEDLLIQFADGETCRYDHHGYCQAHCLHEKPCPFGIANELKQRRSQ
jgi:hypothetical protein